MSPIRSSLTSPAAAGVALVCALATACTPDAELSPLDLGPGVSEPATPEPQVEPLWRLYARTPYRLDDVSRLYRLPGGEVAWLSYNHDDGELHRYVADPAHENVEHETHGEVVGFLREAPREQLYGTHAVTAIGGQPTRIDLATGEVTWRIDRRHESFPQPGNRLLTVSTPCPGRSSLRLVDVETGAFETLLEEPDEHSSLQVTQARLVTLADGTEALFLAQGLGKHHRDGTRLSVYALADMRPLWTTDLVDGAGDWDRSVRVSAPISAGGLLVLPTSQGLLAVDPATGEVTYRTNFGQRDHYGTPESRRVGSVVYDEPAGLLYVHTGHSKLYGVEAATGLVRWESPGEYANTLPLSIPKPGVLLAMEHQETTHLFDGRSGRHLHTIESLYEQTYIFPHPLYDADEDALYYYDGRELYAVDADLHDRGLSTTPTREEG